jgi:hypothetical protein
MKLKSYFVLLIALMIFVSCNREITEKTNFFDLPTHLINQYDSIIIPSLNLDQINPNSNLKEIRILEQSFVFRFGRLFIIKETVLGWKCFRYSYWHTSTDDVFSIKIDTFNVESIIPHSGWNDFINKIDSFNLSSFTNQRNIGGWKEKDINDGTYYLLDFHYQKKRHCYYYHCPELYTEYKNSVQMTDLLNYLNKEIEFNFDRIPAAVELDIILKRKKKTTSNNQAYTP